MAICEASGCMKKNGTRPEKLNDLPFQEAYFFRLIFRIWFSLDIWRKNVFSESVRIICDP